MTGACILVVEDTPLNAEMVTDLLESDGHEVVVATSAEEGLELARRVRPALILMDISLPNMDGLAATQVLKADPATRNIPVVALTAHAMHGDEARVREAGCAGYLTKPIDTRTFCSRVAAFLAAAAGTLGAGQ